MEISDKFLIKIERYLKVLKQKYDKEKKKIILQSFMTEDVDSDIEISDESDAENTNNNENDDNSEDDDLLYSSNADEETI